MAMVEMNRVVRCGGEGRDGGDEVGVIEMVALIFVGIVKLPVKSSQPPHYPTTRRFTSGYCVFLGNNLLSRSAKRQPTLSRSYAKAEYHDVANVVAETCWLMNLLRELHTHLSSATLVYCDNVSVVYLSSNPVLHQRTKHIEIDIHFVQDLVAAGQVRVLHVPSLY
uniref:Ribonuclease H-like domain-containing protein n=1 Tax=Tanacetum cinerariifolium TaxID=118510 RepID=A0A699HXG9_TANCI|nr:ribonuclease H-like domain-containing protein [Tanacetum cinerariifolium]